MAITATNYVPTPLSHAARILTDPRDYLVIRKHPIQLSPATYQHGRLLRPASGDQGSLSCLVANLLSSLPLTSL